MDVTDPLALIHPDADEVSGDEESETSEHPEEPDFEESTFESDLEHARRELGKVIFYLNAVSSAQNQSENISDEKFSQFIDVISDKIITALAFYRQYSRSLTIRCRTAQEFHQLQTSLPSADMAKLERLENELKKTKAAAEKLVSPDYSVFNDLKMLSPDELIRSKPQLSAESYNVSASEYQHFILSEQMKAEMDRRRQVVIEIEELTKKKRSLQDDVRKRKEVMNSVNSDIEKACSVLEPLAEKLGLTTEDLERDISGISEPIMEALRSLESSEEPSSLNSQSQETTQETNRVCDDLEDMETVDIPSPATVATEPSDEIETDQEVVREEGEASDEGEEDLAVT